MNFTKGTYITTSLCGNQCSQECYSNVSKIDAEEYIAMLLQNRYTQTEIYAPNGNIFSTLFNGKELIHVSYINYNNSLKTLSDPLAESIYKVEEPSYTKISDTSLAIIPLDYSHREIRDAHGMSYVITLEDGRFIVIDGGYDDYVKDGIKKEPRDAEIIYEYLQKNNKCKDKITVAAWILTHSHEDHYGAFLKFNRLHKNNVEIQYFIYNSGDPSAYSSEYPTNDFLRCQLPNIIKNDYPTSKIIKPHVGQSISFCNLSITALFTQEGCAPDIKPSANDASLVLRITVNGSSVLFMADSDEAVSSRLVDIYGNTLKSDFMQVNHHGYSGATCELYDHVSPDYTLWTTSKIAFDKRISGEKYEFIGNAVKSNKYIFDKLGRDRCIVADDDVKHIIFKDNGYIIN